MPLLAPDDAPLDIPLLWPLLPDPDEPDPLDDPEPLEEPDPEPLLDDPLEDDPDKDDPLDDIDPDDELPADEEGVPLLEPDDPEGMESVVPLLDGVCVVPDVLLVKAPVV